MSTAYQVDLVFGTRRVDTQLGRLEQKLRQVDRSADRAGQARFDPMSRSAERATGAVDKLGAAIALVGGAAAALAAGRYIFIKTAEIETQTRSLEVLTGSLAKTKTIVAELQAYGAITPFTSTELIDTAKRLSAYNIETEKLVETTKRLGDVAGATGADLQGLVLAYGQTMAKGKFQTEELNQFRERGVAIEAELRRMYKMSGEEFSDALSKGKVSAEAVEVALINLTNTGGKYANGAIAQSTTLQGKLSTLTDSVEMLARTIGTALEPVFKWALDRAIETMTQIQKLIDTAQNPGQAQVVASISRGQMPGYDFGGQNAKAMANLLGGDAEFKAMWQQAGELAKLRRQSQMDVMAKLVGDRLRRTRPELFKDEAPKPAGAPTTPPLIDGRRPGGGGGGISGVGISGVGISGGGSRSAGGGPAYPAYITANQMRAWLKSQGYERTSGDFTNKGHRTPNHMLNAIDIGELDGSYSFAVQRAKALERRLRGTGAFGSQLFGPVSDPRGHKDHVHIPTPGGRIKVTPGLARLMGLSKDGMADNMADWADQAAEQAQRAAEDLEQRRARLEISNAELKIRQATTPLQKIEAEYALDVLRVKQEMAGLTQDETTAQLEQNALLDAQLTKTEKIGAVLVQQAREQEAVLRPLLDDIERLEATFKGPSAVRALDRRNAIGSMSAVGVDPKRAGQLLDEKAIWEQRISAQEKLNALVNEGGQQMRGFLEAMISGTERWQDALAGLLESLGAMLLQIGLEGLAGNDGVGLFSLLGGKFGKSFAGGGYTGSGSRTGGVDGRGGFPAILHPNETVIDHAAGQSAGGQIVNVGGISVSVASDGNSRVDAGSGGELARGIQAAVTAEILRQRRPGGVLAGDR